MPGMFVRSTPGSPGATPDRGPLPSPEGTGAVPSNNSGLANFCLASSYGLVFFATESSTFLLMASLSGVLKDDLAS